MLKKTALILSILFLASSAFSDNKALTDKQHSSPEISLKMLSAADFVSVQGGCFQMGSTEGNSDEKPVHEVCLSDFYIGKYEVTQGLWFQVMGNNPSRFNNCGDDCPVEQVSSSEVIDFIHMLNSLSAEKYRLPTEAEWEYACRSRGKDESFCGGKDIDKLAWFEKNSFGKTHPVGKKQPNSLGIYDMSGNVWEWVQDWKDEYSKAPQLNPHGSSIVSTRVRRGGSWHYGADQSRSSWRSSGYPDDRALDIGFRLVRDGIR